MIPETGHTESEDKFPLEASWRDTLPTAYRTIAQRYGKNHFILAWSVGSIREAVALLSRRVSGNREMMNCIHHIVQSSNNLATFALDAQELNAKLLGEIQRDIERASVLAGATVQEGKIILAS